MQRRKFIKAGTIASAVLPFLNSTSFNLNKRDVAAPKFNMKFAPHTGMFEHLAGKDPIDQIKFMSDQGFTAFEDNYLKDREPVLQSKIGEALAKLNMEMGVFVGGRVKTENNKPSLVLNDESINSEFLKRIKDSIESSKRVNAKWMTVLPGHLDQRKEIGYQTANVVELFKRAAGLLEPHGLTMVLEPLNFYNHPGLFLTRISQAYQILQSS